MNQTANGRRDRDRELFDSVAEQYLQKDLLPAQIAARRYRLRQTIARVDGLENREILEVGCGAGFSAEYLDGLYTRYTGVDYSAALIKLAIKHNSRENTRFLVSDIDDLELTEQFDVVFMIGLLHHTVDPVASLKRILRFVRPSGQIVANEPQSGNPAIRLAREIREKLDSDYSAEQEEYSKAQLFEIFERSGLQQISIHPQGVFSTPFAEVCMPAQALFTPLSVAACAVDRVLESALPELLSVISWNLIAVGRKC